MRIGWFSIRNVAMSWKKLERQWVDNLFHHRWKWHFTLEFGMWNIQKILKFFYLPHFTWVGGKYTDMVEREEFKAMWLKWTKTITKLLSISAVVRPHYPRMPSASLSAPVWTPFTDGLQRGCFRTWAVWLPYSPSFNFQFLFSHFS